MADRERRGMLITNNASNEVEIAMASRTLRIGAGEETLITPEEVRDPALRVALQERSISIVRPATEAEDASLQDRSESNEG
jgi:DNA-directed RNA polymerase subunit K/omega